MNTNRKYSDESSTGEKVVMCMIIAILLTTVGILCVGQLDKHLAGYNPPSSSKASTLDRKKASTNNRKPGEKS